MQIDIHIKVLNVNPYSMFGFAMGDCGIAFDIQYPNSNTSTQMLGDLYKPLVSV